MSRNSKITAMLLVTLMVIAGILKLAHGKKDSVTSSTEVTESQPGENPAATASRSATVTTSTTLPNQAASDSKNTDISAQLEQLGTCLGLKNSVSNHAEATFAELNSSLQPELGNVAMQNEEWSNTHLRLPNGEERRIHIEVDADNEESSVRKLKYYGVDKEGLPLAIELPKEQTTNPTETFIAGLESEGKITLREKAMHAYYQNGTEVLYTEKNGLLSDLEISKNGRTFKCTSLSTAASCRCF
jgi:hypothetical protein